MGSPIQCATFASNAGIVVMMYEALPVPSVEMVTVEDAPAEVDRKSTV